MAASVRPPHRRSAAALRSSGDPPPRQVDEPAAGEERLQERRLVSLWADLLSALQQGSPGIATSAEEMAGDLPRELVVPVNRELRQRGCSFQVSLRRREAPAAASCAPVHERYDEAAGCD
jgi:hypothetical protein